MLAGRIVVLFLLDLVIENCGEIRCAVGRGHLGIRAQLQSCDPTRGGSCGLKSAPLIYKPDFKAFRFLAERKGLNRLQPISRVAHPKS
jgi:hypothetical protein